MLDWVTKAFAKYAAVDWGGAFFDLYKYYNK